MPANRRAEKIRGWVVLIAIALAAAAPGALAGEFQGSVELMFRNLSQDGSERKFEEDFDGLESGIRVSSFTADWQSEEDSALDYARLDLDGLGGEPYERNAFRIGRKDRFELSLTRTKQDYLYDLFELVPDEDGALWDSERERLDLDLTVHPHERVKLLFGFEQVRRDGTSLVMKDINRNLFRLETPLDSESKRYSVGVQWDVGPVDLFFRQSLRRYDHDFRSHTENNLGLESGATLDEYSWNQLDNGASDLTELRVHAPLGQRVDLSASLSGTLLGEEELRSRIGSEARGLDFTGAEFGGRCLATGAPCATDAQCDAATPGDVCQGINGLLTPGSEVGPGESRAELEGDVVLAELGLTVAIADPLDLHLQYRSFSRDFEGTLFRDLSGGPPGEPDGIEDDEDGDGTPGSRIRQDYTLDTWTALLEYHPTRKVGLRGGLRSIDRELERDGYGANFRSSDFESDGDEAVLLGVTLRPVSWFRFNADYEDGDIDQPFNSVAPAESEHLRVRAVFTPQEDMSIRATYLDNESKNDAFDFRDAESACDGIDNDGDSTIDEGCWDGRQETTTYALDFANRAGERLGYSVRYAKQEVDSDVRIAFDEAGFGSVGLGRSIFAVDNTQWSARIDCDGRPLRGFVRYLAVESDGDNRVTNAGVGFAGDQPIVQDYVEGEAGLSYFLGSGLYVGGSYRYFDYDDRNDLLDYDGQELLVRAGLSF